MVPLRQPMSTLPTLTGGKSSHMRDNISAISITRSVLMLKVRPIRKAKLLTLKQELIMITKFGRLPILTKPSQSQPRDLTKSSVCTSTDHSISYPDSQ